MILCDIMCSLYVSWFVAIKVTLTTQRIINEDAGVLKVHLNLDKPSPCCVRVYVQTIDIMAEGKWHVLYVYLCACACVCACVLVHMCMCLQVYIHMCKSRYT